MLTLAAFPPPFVPDVTNNISHLRDALAIECKTLGPVIIIDKHDAGKKRLHRITSSGSAVKQPCLSQTDNKFSNPDLILTLL